MTNGEKICTRCGQAGHVAASCKKPMPGKRGINVIQDLKDRSDIDPVTHCWNWQGAFQGGTPRIHTFDYRTGEKQALSGPLAVWMIAHEEAPREGWLVFRRCTSKRCVNPAHHEQARDQAEIGAFVAAQGRRKGSNIHARQASAARGRAIQGIVETPDETIIAIASRLMVEGYKRGDGKRLGDEFNVPRTLISRIATGQRNVPGVGKLSLKQFSFHKRHRTSQRSIANLAAYREGFAP
jgi:hypothetical protein